MYKINKDIWKLWKQFTPVYENVECFKRKPLVFHKPPKTGCLLFIGFNPSYNLEGLAKISKKTILEIKELYSINKDMLFDDVELTNFIENERELSIVAEEKYPYFSKFKLLSKYIGLEYEHIDLFYMREVNQQSATGLVIDSIQEERQKNGTMSYKIELSNFGDQQFKITKEVIEMANPKAIIVVNAMASRIISYMLKTEVDLENGYSTSTVMLKNVPIFYSSMLTGQRSLDNFSFERLQWHMSKVLNSKKR